MTRFFQKGCHSIIAGDLLVKDYENEVIFDAPRILWRVDKNESVKLAHDVRNALEGGWKNPEAERFDVSWLEDDYIGIEHKRDIIEIHMFDAEELCDWLEERE